MKGLLTLLPFFPPQAIVEQGPLAILQYKVLQSLLLAGLLTGSIWYAFRIDGLVQTKSWDQVAFSTLILVFLTALIVFTKRSFGWRAGLSLALMVIYSTYSTFQTGFSIATLATAFGLAFFSMVFYQAMTSAAIVVLWAAINAGVLFVSGRGSDMLSLINTPTLEGVLGIIFICLGAVVVVLTFPWMRLEYRQMQDRQDEAIKAVQDKRRGSEHRLKEQTQHLQHQLIEASVAANISRRINSIHVPDMVLNEVVAMIHERFKQYYTGVFLIDEDNRFAVLRAGSGEAGQRMVSEGHRLLVSGPSMVGWAITNREARVTSEASIEESRYSHPRLPHTRSEIALPILTENDVIGAVTIQSVQPNAFDDVDVTILQGIADSLGIALENARLYQQTQEALEEARLLTANYLNQSWNEVAQSQGQLSYTYENPTTEPVDNMVEHEFLLTLRDTMIGKVTLEVQRDVLTEDDKAFIDAVAVQTAVALENARLLEETQRHALEEQKLNELTAQFSQAVSIEDILKRAVQELGNLPAVTDVAIHLVSPQGIDSSSDNNGIGLGHRPLEVSS